LPYPQETLGDVTDRFGDADGPASGVKSGRDSGRRVVHLHDRLGVPNVEAVVKLIFK
jgi:hypothetical protein